ncbi:MAG: adenylate cyclase [Alphaproteobacteria bacterium]|jgi:adenylate cyclase
MDQRGMGQLGASGPVCDLDNVQQLSDWLVQQGLMGANLSDLLQGFCDRLVDMLGLPLWRGQVGMRTLHPSFEAMFFIWRRGQTVEGNQVAHTEGDSDQWRRSPFYYMLNEELYVFRKSLDGPESALGFPMLEEFREQGGTDYVARILPFGDGGAEERLTGVLASWTSDRPGGFNESEVSALDRLQPRLALTIKTILAAEITKKHRNNLYRRRGGDAHPRRENSTRRGGCHSCGDPVYGFTRVHKGQRPHAARRPCSHAGRLSGMYGDPGKGAWRAGFEIYGRRVASDV